jgi:hypothetical protein
MTRTMLDMKDLRFNGHMLVWDPPAVLTGAKRWICSRCGAAWIRYGANEYGSATSRVCPVWALNSGGPACELVEAKVEL